MATSRMSADEFHRNDSAKSLLRLAASSPWCDSGGGKLGGVPASLARRASMFGSKMAMARSVTTLKKWQP